MGLRFGRVASVNASGTVRVNFSDVDKSAKDLESFDLPVLVLRAGDYGLPTKDTLVACLMDPGPAGVGVVLGVIYSDSDAAPLSDAGQRSIKSSDLRLGSDPTTSIKAAKAPTVNNNFSDLKSHLQAIEEIITGPPITEPGNGAPSAFQTALAAAIGISPLPDPDDVSASDVSIK